MNFTRSMAEIATVACEINDNRILPKSNTSYHAGAVDVDVDVELNNIDIYTFGRSMSFNNNNNNNRLYRQNNNLTEINDIISDDDNSIMHHHHHHHHHHNNDSDEELYHALLTPVNTGLVTTTTIITADNDNDDNNNNNNNDNNSDDSDTKTIIRRVILRGKNHRTNNINRICACVPRTFTCSWYINYLLLFCAFCTFLMLAYLTRDYARRLLFWIEIQNSTIVFLLFIMFFILVSFPIIFGYFLLMITSGYLFGCLKGLLTVILGANMGIAIAHLTMANLRNRIPIHKIIKNETGRAILRVISGPRAFRVVLFTRLTPIPFGLQNAIFGVSSVNSRIYFTATFLGLLPAQVINVYLGSTLRSMHEVLNNHGTALTGYISIGLEVICGVALMFWVVQKARNELSETLLTDISNEGKLLDIQV